MLKGDFEEKLKKIDSGGIQTHARKTAALTQHLNVNVILIKYPDLYTWFSKTWTMEYSKIGKRGNRVEGQT
jgi:hypothetical protein